MDFFSLGKIFEPKPKAEVPATAVSGPYEYVLRLDEDGKVEKIFIHQPGGFYKSDDGELVTVYTVQRIRWQQLGGENYTLSRTPYLALQIVFDQTLASLPSRRLREAQARLQKLKG